MAAAASPSSAADLPQPQVVPSSRDRCQTGTRVWMVTDGREKGRQEWVKADVYRTEESIKGLRVSVREVGGRNEEFTVMVPHQTRASNAVHKGFRLVEKAPLEQPVGKHDGSTTEVVFECHCERTRPGDELSVVGVVDELGKWDVTKALPLDGSAYPIWRSALVCLPAPVHSVEFKFVLRLGDGGWEWERFRGNREATLLSSDGRVTFVKCAFDDKGQQSVLDIDQPRLFQLPQEVELELYQLLGNDLAIGLARFRRTCRMGNLRVSDPASGAYLRTQINQQLAAKGLEGIIALSPDLTSIALLLQLSYFIDHSGEWAGWEPIIRVAVHQRRGEGRLPIELTSADVEGVGSRPVYDSRCEAMRQLSLIQRHLGMTLERINDEERLNGYRLTIHRLQTLPPNSPFRDDRFDEANPVCEMPAIHYYASVRDLVLYEMQLGASEVAYEIPNAYLRLRQLARQQPPAWNCRTISTSHRSDGPAAGNIGRVIVLHGDQRGHTFEAHIFIGSYATLASAHLYTTERPVAGRVGAARFPQTVRVVRQVMGADA